MSGERRRGSMYGRNVRVGGGTKAVNDAGNTWRREGEKGIDEKIREAEGKVEEGRNE